MAERETTVLQPETEPKTERSALTSRAASAKRARHLAPSCRGSNFFAIDHSLRSLLPLYMEASLLAHLEPHLDALGELAGGRLDELAVAAERHPPMLHARDALGRDEEWIEFHPAYREMEAIGFGRFGLHAMGHRPGVLGWPAPLPPLAKYVFHYLFAQAEFGLLCPINLTDSSSALVRSDSVPLKLSRLTPSPAATASLERLESIRKPP